MAKDKEGGTQEKKAKSMIHVARQYDEYLFGPCL